MYLPKFSEEEIKDIYSHTKKCSKSLLIQEMQIKTTLKYHITPIRLANMTEQEDDKCWRGCGRVGLLKHCWCCCELIQPFWEANWNYVQRAIKMCIHFDPTVPSLYPKEIIQMGKGPTCRKIFIAALFVVAKNCKLGGCPSIGGWLTKLWYMNVMECYCAIRNDKTVRFQKKTGKTYMN